MTIKPIPSIPGAFANDEGKIKLPEGKAKMPNGGVRTYETIWILGSRRRASKTARHEYYGVLHRGKNYKVHRLVCEAFHGPAPEGKNIVLHLDEDATNNKPCNLRWGTQKENLNMPKFVEYCQGRTGGDNPYIKGKIRKGEA
jgi:hypothetical protein